MWQHYNKFLPTVPITTNHSAPAVEEATAMNSSRRKSFQDEEPVPRQVEPPFKPLETDPGSPVATRLPLVVPPNLKVSPPLRSAKKEVMAYFATPVDSEEEEEEEEIKSAASSQNEVMTISGKCLSFEYFIISFCHGLCASIYKQSQ